ncbi:MAG: class II aldolase and adducin N-terminal domain-containing protein [Alphaproteobacteria bacterium]|nr:class II aldolase and adducin N-terminal domain-containing protein [Alphaproteobacteria bacterium]
MQLHNISDDNEKRAFYQERVDLAASLRWTMRLNMHEAVSNHFSLAVSDDGKMFLMNPNQRHFSNLKASDMLLLNADDTDTLNQPDAPDKSAWGLHGSVHRHCPHVKCMMHVHSIYATVLASLADSTLPPIDQNTAIFFNRHIVDDCFGGMAFTDEGTRCATMLQDPKIQVMVMGNHGILVLGDTVAQTFNRMYFFERAAETYIKALWTQKELRLLSDEVAEKVAHELETEYSDQATRHFSELKQILDREEPDYKD